MTPDVLTAQDYKIAFDRVALIIPQKNKFNNLLHDLEIISQDFIRVLKEEKRDEHCLSSFQASLEGHRTFQLLDRLFYIIPATSKNDQLLKMLALSTGMWVAHREGEIKKLEFLVNALATFANQTYYQPYLEELYEISLYLIHATASSLKFDANKANMQRPWRLLCLNHCIIATRTGNRELAGAAYDHLIHHLPEEADAFFQLGVQEVNAGQYPYSVQNIMLAYYQKYSQKQHALVEPRVVLN